MQSKVSVIIPCFNAIRFLKKTLDSVFKQSYANIELIIVDDGSTDGTLEYLSTLQQQNVIVKSNTGKGACAARNYGYELSSGEYVQFLDADDLLSADKIEKQVALLEKSPNKIAVCSTKHFVDSKDNGVITDRDFLYTTDDTAGFLLNLYGANGTFEMIQTSAWLTPRVLIAAAGLWDESLSKDQDGEFFCRMVMTSNGVLFEPEGLNYYRKHPSGANIANQNQRHHLESQFDALQSKALQLISSKDVKAYKKAMALQYKFLAVEAWPQFKDISYNAWLRSKDYGGSKYLPVLGGRVIETIKHIFGWKMAKSFSYWLHTNRIIEKLRIAYFKKLLQHLKRFKHI